MRQLGLGLAVATMVAISGMSGAEAHHSAAVFYDANSRVTVTGQVIRFNFRNPHAIVELQVRAENGEDQRWTAETSAPSALRRRGWSQESLTPGETVTLEGLKALDGSHFMRIVSATRADGTEIGLPRGTDN